MVTVTLPKAARAAVLTALRHHAKIKATVSVIARDAAGNASAPKLVSITLTA